MSYSNLIFPEADKTYLNSDLKINGNGTVNQNVNNVILNIIL